MNMFSVLAPIYDTMLGRLQQRQGTALLTRLPEPKGKSVLDVGGGTGRLARRLREAGADTWLLDASSSMLKRAQSVLPADRVFLGDASGMPFADHFFDLATMVDALHHFPRQEQAIRETFRVLRPGGSLYILDFTPQSPSIRVLQRMERLVGETSVFLTPAALTDMLLSAGFSSPQTEYLSAYEYLTQAKVPAR